MAGTLEQLVMQMLHRMAVAVMVWAALTVADTHAARANGDGPVDEAATTSLYRTIKLGLNRSLVIDLPRDARDVLVSNPVIADAVIRTPRRIYLTGVAVGQANIIVFDGAGNQIVSLDLEVERDSSTLERMLRRLIPDSDITVELVTDNIVLSGSVKNAADARRAQDIATIFANGGAQAPPAPSPGGGGADTGGAGSSSVNISLGASEPPTSSVVNLLSIEGEDQVHLKVTVAEIQRNIAKQLGIEFSGKLNTGTITSTIVAQHPFAIATKALSANQITGGWNQDANNNLTGTIRALEQTGMIRTLAEPTLTAISGESASFLAGGEFPVPTGRDQQGNITIEFKPFGVALSFTPVVLSEGRISLHVKTEVSELSAEGSFTITGQNGNDLTVPGLKVRRAESTMELPSGGALVLGGLIQDTVRQSIGGLPGLKQIPILGTLFRSRDFQRNETELVIIITPYLVKPVPRSALARADEGFNPASDAQTIFLGAINRVYRSDGPQTNTESYTGQYGFIYE